MEFPNEDDPEEQFFEKWISQHKAQSEVSEELIRELVENATIFPNAVGTIVRRICEKGFISAEQASELICFFPKSSFSYKQLSAYMSMSNQAYTWLERLRLSVSNKASWSVDILLDSIALSDYHEAMLILKGSGLQRSLRVKLNEVVKKKYGVLKHQ